MSHYYHGWRCITKTSEVTRLWFCWHPIDVDINCIENSAQIIKYELDVKTKLYRKNHRPTLLGPFPLGMSIALTPSKEEESVMPYSCSLFIKLSFRIPRNEKSASAGLFVI